MQTDRNIQESAANRRGQIVGVLDSTCDRHGRPEWITDDTGHSRRAHRSGITLPGRERIPLRHPHLH